MEQFPHLKFVQKIKGKPRLRGGGSENPKTSENKANRRSHSQNLQRWITQSKSNWNSSFSERERNNLAELEKDIQPIFLQVNPDIIDLQFNLENFGIEIISEEEDGFIIGASLDNFRSLEKKVKEFIDATHGSGKIADFWKIFDGDRSDWKPKHILSEELFSKWDEIVDEDLYSLEVSVAFNKPLKAPNTESKFYQKQLDKYLEDSINRDEMLMKRESHFQEFIKHYGDITSDLIDLDDSFGCEVKISGKGLKDLVVNYQFVFEVIETEQITGVTGTNDAGLNFDLEVYEPPSDAVEVAVIDSGIMESNKFIMPAIKADKSKSYIEGDSSVADYVIRGGHGTKVAGAILYPDGVTTQGNSYQLPCFIRNLRVLDANNSLKHSYPAGLMKQIVEENKDCPIFNLSIGSKAPYRLKHMSMWAAIIDDLSHKHDVLFLISAGNLPFKAIEYYLSNKLDYPSYLLEPYCRIVNPAQSAFGLTVGSINHTSFDDGYWKSLGSQNDIAGYSRVGMGIWGQIKPDVVEFGGGVVHTNNGASRVKEHASMASELIRSTLHGGNVVGNDSVGTSFSTPKVSHIAAKLKSLYPNEGFNLLRALIVQGARLPNEFFLNPTYLSLKHFGYGLPSLERVTKNNDNRITFYSTGQLKAEEGHLYSLSMPESIMSQADEYDLLIEVTLAYSADIRRTRQKTKSYLSTWLDWNSSKIGESFNDFKDYALKEIRNSKTSYDKDYRKSMKSINWKLKNFKGDKSGSIPEVSRNDNTVQKDWAFIKSYELPDEVSFTVNGHKGWDVTQEAIPYAFVVSIEVLGTNIPIYQEVSAENEIELESRS